ncbi:major histocompatibility complex class I-related gene protein-like [Gracilinanus agilis]|uniref:major histocompatibility complex class I-related gene protein-like n=1 Tax=Gracilinanus agilis TaxID=191870 RepID=UPI001CFD694F|nr:major histocompatibility complex class I-related gene protein-like [Gracilinanus agilis]
MVSFIDDVHLCTYHKLNQTDWMSSVLCANFSEKMQTVLLNHEENFHRLIHYLEQNDTKNEKSHTLQLYADCELEDDIQVDSHVHLAWDGEDLFRRDEQQGYWIFLKPMGYVLKPAVESPFWESVRRDYVQKYCFDIMRKILRYSRIHKNVPPQVTVSRHDDLGGTITLFCTATGFYPQSILLGWKKGYEHAIWGKESSSGILPNADGTFYLQVTLELLPGDPGIGYTCVVEHTELKSPAVYPVAGKSTKKAWPMALAIMLSVILVVSCSLAFVTWKKKTGLIPPSFSNNYGTFDISPALAWAPA